ncbi:MAG: glycine zipper 2TM domain-containing protein [Parasulfuritortus sp.]|jgi:uncharacterized protein YcfJ|nr:glycine zipper 2TM domain-containing protein [Parasulfuritortus sp.]
MKLTYRTLPLALSSMLALATATAWAEGPYPPVSGPVSYTDTARVVSSTPVYEQVNAPTRECWREQTGYTTEPSDHSYGGAVLGAIVGGVVGHQIGRGGGRDAATAAGAAIGAVTGDNMDNRDRTAQTRPVEEERCRTVDHWTQRVSGYNVVYRYKGGEYSTIMPYDPGATVRLNVSISVISR